MRFLVTGGSGFLGGHVLERLSSQGHEVLSIDVASPVLFGALPGVVHRRGDVRDTYLLKKAIDEFGGIDAIIHLAGVLGTAWLLDREEFAVEHNVNGTLSVMRLGRDLDVKVVAPMVANRWLNPYTITKRAAADFMRMFRQEYGCTFTLVRETHVYGPRQVIDERQKIIPTLIGCALLGRPLPLFMQGEQRVDLVHASDVAESLIRVARSGQFAGEEVEFASGRLVRVKDVARMILEYSGSDSELLLLGRRPGQTGEDEPYNDLDCIFRACGRWPVVGLEEGLRLTVDWYREHFEEVGGWFLRRADDALVGERR
jgi:UDP-glucose 4-epimerase